MFFKHIAILFFLFLLLFITPQAFAQVIPMESITPSPVLKSNEIEYPLPYPGILPNKPFFILKNLRDKLIEVFTLNPLKKTDFYLLQADKNLSSSIILFDLGEKGMATKVFIKSQKYLEKAIDEEGKAKKLQGNLMELSEKIKQSSRKQTEVANNFYDNLNEKTGEKFKKELDRAADLEKRAEEFRL